MNALPAMLPFLFVVFLLAGTVKGVTGMGLPTVAMALLALRLPPAQAAALLVLPSLFTNLQQALSGGALGPLLRRLWPMLLAIAATTGFGARVLAGHDAGTAQLGLGAMLMFYALLGLSRWEGPSPGRHERWAGPLAGALTGLATGATGVFVLPSTPYLVALRLPRETLMQALGLCFSVATLALAASLSRHRAFSTETLLASCLVLLPTVLGMLLGNRLRARLPPLLFRRFFFGTLALLGAQLVWRALAGHH